MTTTPLSEVHDQPIHSTADLEVLWGALMGEGGFGRRTVWLVLLDTQARPVPMIMPIEQVPVEPDPIMIDGLSLIIDQLIADDPTIRTPVLLLSRPGPGTMTADDRAWARMLAPLSQWPIFLATTDRRQIFAPDDLVPDR